MFLTDEVVPTGIKETPFKVKKPEADFRDRNKMLVGKIVRHMRDNTGEPDDILYSRINGCPRPTFAVGVKYVDDMTPPEVWERRYVWLKLALSDIARTV